MLMVKYLTASIYASISSEHYTEENALLAVKFINLTCIINPLSLFDKS